MKSQRRQLLGFYLIVLLLTLVDMAFLIGLFWSSLEITGSPMALGVVLCFSVLLPFSIQKIFTKTLALSRLSFRTTMSIRLVVAVIIFVLVKAHALHGLSGFVAISTMIGLSAYFTSSCLESLNIQFVLKGAISSDKAARWMQTAIQLGAFSGAAAGGILLEAAGVDHFASLLCYLGFAVSALVLLMPPAARILSDSPDSQATSHSTPPAARKGTNQAVYSACVALGMIGFHIGCFNTLTPVIYQHLRHWTAGDFGMASAVAGAGAFAAAILPKLRVPALIPALALIVVDGCLAFSEIRLLSIGACFVLGYSVNHLRIQMRRDLTDLAKTQDDANRISSLSAFVYLLMQAAAPLLLAMLVSDRLLGEGSAPLLFIGVASLLAIGVILRTCLGESSKTVPAKA